MCIPLIVEPAGKIPDYLSPPDVAATELRPKTRSQIPSRETTPSKRGGQRRRSVSPNPEPSTKPKKRKKRKVLMRRHTSVVAKSEIDPVAAPRKDSARVWFHPREDMRGEPLVVVRFEGVVGVFIRVSLWLQGEELYLRPDTHRALQRLRAKFRLVMVCGLNWAQVSRVLQLLHTGDFCFDAVYTSPGDAGKAYEQLAADFGMRDDQALVLDSIPLSDEDVAGMQDGAVLDMNDNFGPAVIVMLTDPRMQPGMRCVPLDSVVAVVESLAREGDWAKGFDRIRKENKNLRHIVGTLPGPNDRIAVLLAEHKKAAREREALARKFPAAKFEDNKAAATMFQRLSDLNVDIAKGIRRYYGEFYRNSGEIVTTGQNECVRLMRRVLVVPQGAFPAAECLRGDSDFLAVL